MKAAVADLRSKGYRIQSVNILSNKRLVEKYRVRRNPTFVYVENGEVAAKRTGFQTSGALQRMCKGYWF